MSVKQGQTVRQFVAARTQAAHQRLHENPLLGQLAHPKINKSEYHAALQIFHAVFQRVEALRRSQAIWPELSVQAQCDRLTQDRSTTATPIDLALHSKPAVLGALYALHGSQFGGAIISRNIQAALPHEPQAYFSTKGNVAQWKDLVGQLETYQDQDNDIAEIVAGANRVFSTMDAMANPPSRP